MTTAHNTLTGTDLHESKGASTATAGQVAIANGSGNAPFGTLGPSSLSPAANPFGAQLLHVREEQATNVPSSSTNASNTWTTCVLNTSKTTEITSATLVSNQISLPAGTYYISAFTLRNVTYANGPYFSKVRFRNITSSTNTVYGPSLSYVNGSSELQVVTPLSGRFTIAGTTIFELQYYSTNNSVSSGPAASGVPEVWSDVQIWKVA